MLTEKDPLFSVCFTVSLRDYELCQSLLARNLRQRQMYKSVVLGVLFVMVALAFIGFIFYRRRGDGMLYALSVALLATGIYNILYFPFFFERFLAAKNRREYGHNPYFKEPARLDFFADSFVEHSAAGENRVMWQSVKGMVEMQALYFLRITQKNGIIIPKNKLDSETLAVLDSYLREIGRRFGKELSLIE